MTSLSRLAIIIAVTAVAPTVTAVVQQRGRQQRTIKSVKSEQKAVKAEVRKVDREITQNTRETERSLGRLSVLSRKMEDTKAEIAASQAGLDSLDRAIARRNDSIAILEERLDMLRKSYAAALKAQQLYPDVNSPLAFVFSASSVTEAYRRMRYLRQYDRWRARRSAELSEAVGQLEEARRQLTAAKASRAEAHRRMQQERDRLATEQAATDSLVASLRREGTSLRAVMAEKQRRMDALDSELNRLIAEEQARIERERREAEERRRREAAKAKGDSRKGSGSTTHADTPADSGRKGGTSLDATAEADRKLTGSFVANKGRLLFPVAGRYRITRGFGRQRHPELKHVETNNNGIDIEVAPGTDARAIFDGTVSRIFQLPGYANVVMIRHGEYISLYANIVTTNVTKGQTVKAGQSIGRILTESEDEGGATTLHFELRRERAKLNPLEWVK